MQADYRKLEVPSLGEGFDEIFKLKIVDSGEFSVQLIET